MCVRYEVIVVADVAVEDILTCTEPDVAGLGVTRNVVLIEH